MTLSLLDEIRASRDAIVTTTRTVLDTAKNENRALSPVERQRYDDATTTLGELDERIAEHEQRAADRQRYDALAAEIPTPTTVNRGGSPARVVTEQRMYTPARSAVGERSFFADAFAAERGDYAARDRIAQHIREAQIEGEFVESRATTTGSFAGLVIPQYLTDMAALALRNGRPFANACHRLELPEQGMSLIVPRGTTAATAASQATENTAVSATDEVWANLTVPVVTIAGGAAVSRQSLERGTPGMDRLIMSDLAGAYAAELDRQVITGTGASGQMLGVLNTAGINAATAFGAAPTATNFTSKLAGQIAAIAGSGTVLTARVVAMNPRRWGWFSTLMDSTGRPLVEPLSGGPFNVVAFNNSPGATSADGSPTEAQNFTIVGMIQGLPVVTDGNIPINVGTNVEDVVIVADTMQLLLWEQFGGVPRQLRFDQPLVQQLTTQLVVYGYAAFTAARYPTASGKIGGLDATATWGLVAPTF